MSNIEIMNQATKLYAEWESAGSPGFWLDFYTKHTGFDLGDEQYDLVHEMTAEGMLP
jgi:hypothetical protein